MNSYRVFSHPVDSKREEFRKYLEKAGVLDVLTRALVELLDTQDRPADAMELKFLRQQLASTSPHVNEIATLKDELSKINEQIKLLQTENSNLKSKLQQYEENAAAAVNST